MNTQNERKVEIWLTVLIITLLKTPIHSIVEYEIAVVGEETSLKLREVAIYSEQSKRISNWTSLNC